MMDEPAESNTSTANYEMANFSVVDIICISIFKNCNYKLKHMLKFLNHNAMQQSDAI